MLEFTIEKKNGGGSLIARLEGQQVGHIDFVDVGADRIDLAHTRVFPEYEGRGYGRQLVAAAVDFARSEGLTLRASCPYAAQVLDRRPDWSDVWPKA